MMEAGVSHRPRFRQDLIAEPIDDAADSGTRFIDVMNPDSGHVFRFYEVEYSIACAMDGERDVPGIVKWAKDELGLTATTREVQSVIATLHEFGYLEVGAAISAAPSAEPTQAPVPARAPTPVQAPVPVHAVEPVAAGPAPAQKPIKGPQPVEAAPTRGAASTDRAATIPDLELGQAGPPPSHADTPMGVAADIELGSGILVGAQARVSTSPPVEDIALGQPGRVDTAKDLKPPMGVATDDASGRDSQAARAEAAAEAAAIELAASRPEERPTRHPTRPQPAPHVAQRAGRGSDRPTSADMSDEQRTEPAVIPAAAPPEPAFSPAKAEPAFSQPAMAAEPAFSPAAKAADPVVERAPSAESPRPAESAPRPRSDSWRGSQQLPPQRSAEPVAPRPPAEPPEEPRVSRLVLGLLAAAIVSAVAFVTYKIVVKKSATRWEPPAVQVQPPTPTPEPLPVEVQKLATSPELIESIKPAAPSVVEKIHETAVTRGEVIVEYAGHKRIAAEIANLERDIEKRVEPEVAAAQKDRDAAQAAGAAGKLALAQKRLADRQRSLNDKQAKLAVKRAELLKLELKAPADGKVVAQVSAGAKVTPADEIAKLTHTSMRIATFKNAGGNPGTRVHLVSTASSRRFSCVISKVDASGTMIVCPLDVAPESTEVTFGGIDTTPPEPEAEVHDSEQIQIDPVAPGSAATTPGSGAAPSGSAPPVPAQPNPPPSKPAPPPAESPAEGSGESNAAPSSPPATSGAPAENPGAKPAEPASDTPPAAPAPAAPAN